MFEWYALKFWDLVTVIHVFKEEVKMERELAFLSLIQFNKKYFKSKQLTFDIYAINSIP